MATPLVPQEMYLLERYASADYFASLRDAWSAAVAHAERCLDAFTRSLPTDYRKRPLFDQPDIVWGERVLPNFRSTREYLNAAFIRITHGDLGALGYASHVNSDFAAMSRDYSTDWMDGPAVVRQVPGGADAFWNLLAEATERASNIAFTSLAQWNMGDLRENYHLVRGPLDPPAEWPTYRLDSKVRAATGQPTPRTGIYLPDVSDSAAALMIEGHPAPLASVGYNPTTTQNIRAEASVWTLVERVADDGGGLPGDADPIRAGVRLRCAAGQPCPRAGFWFTPARQGSRRQFFTGEVMPAVGGDYGASIWQWDDRQ